MSEPAERIPVLIGVGEICDRPAVEVEGLDSMALMLASLREAERDAGASVLGQLDWLGVEAQISFPDPSLQDDLAGRLPTRPRHVVRTLEASGDGPLQLLNDAANLIGRGEIGLAAVVGAEALRTAAARARTDLAAGRKPPANSIADVAAAGARPLVRRYGLLTPTDVYPLYENATRAAWGQSLAEAQRESAEIWSGFSATAAANDHAWLRRFVAPDVIETVTADNRMLSFPYTKLMVANASVNMGAALIVASLARARELGVADDRLVFVGRGAAAHEDEDFLRRDGYAHLASLESTIALALDRNGLGAADLDHVELYSCFPCVTKMARRALGWPTDRPASVYGGLTFGGGPIGNCMTHAAAQMVRKLRQGGTHGLIVANGGYATHSHSMVLTRTPQAAGLFPQDYSAEDAARARRGTIPPLIEDHEGPGVIETFSVPFDRQGAPRFAAVIGRTKAGGRFLAHVPGDDEDGLAFLTSARSQPIGAVFQAVRDGDKVIWRR